MPPPGDYTLTPVEHDPWAEAQTHQAERPNPAAPIVNFGKLFAKTMADRAISAVTSAVTAPRDALFGTMQVTDPETGMPTQEAMKRGQDVANLAMTGGIPFARQGAAGMAGGKLAQPPKLQVSDDGTRINIAPENMQVPEWGKGLSWGLTAYRSKVKGEDAIHVRDARLPPEMQGQGHGTAMYKHAADLAAKEGKPLLSDGTVTEDAANRWMALNRAGYNVQMAPDKVFRPGPPEAPHLGRFETPDGSPVFRVELKSNFSTAKAGAAGMAGGRLGPQMSMPSKFEKAPSTIDDLMPAFDSISQKSGLSGRAGPVYISDLAEKTGLSKEQVRAIVLDAAEAGDVSIHNTSGGTRVELRLALEQRLKRK
jgi:predicted GNAT family acetyltransferase